VTTPAAGWYPDPGGSGGQRYWSGTAWTDQVTSAEGPKGPNPALAQSHWPPLSPTSPDGEPESGQSPSDTGHAHEEIDSQEIQHTQIPPAPPVPPDGTIDYRSPAASGGPLWGSQPAPTMADQVQPDPRMKFGPDGQVLAGWWRRLLGYLIDGLAIGFVTGLAVAIFGALSGTFGEVINIPAFEALMDNIEQSAEKQQPYQPTAEELNDVLGPGFWTLFFMGWLLSVILGVLNGVVLVARSGQTIGDRIVQTRKVVAGRRPPSIGRAFLRWLIPAALILASNIPVLGVVGYAAWLVDYLRPLWNVQRQTWHDKASSTFVERADLAGPLPK
jgi:uncharacterized RDD family membrane protein YckC